MIVNNKFDQNLLNSQRRSYKVLLVAYACSPYRGSEPGVGWHWSVEIAKRFDTWVLCEKREFEQDIKKYFNENGPNPRLHFLFIPKPAISELLRKISPVLFYFAYNVWHRRAFRAAKHLYSLVDFDLVHQVNMVGFREPGYLWKLDIPFIWGPVGGTQNYPWRFLATAGIKGAIFEGFRSILNILQLHFNRRVRKAAKKASVLLAANSVGVTDFQKHHHVKALLMLETGIEKLKNKDSNNSHKKDFLRILWSGSFEYHKALNLLLQALSEIPDSYRYELRILGKGCLEKNWRRLARKKGIEKYCKWLGFISHDKVIEQYDWADVLVFTSLRDTSGNVVLEALSRGVPVVCLNHQGVKDIITSDCGKKIPVTTPKDVIVNLRDAIVELIVNRDLLDQFSIGAIERAKKYLWSCAGDKMGNIYDNVLKERKNHCQKRIRSLHL